MSFLGNTTSTHFMPPTAPRLSSFSIRLILDSHRYPVLAPKNGELNLKKSHMSVGE